MLNRCKHISWKDSDNGIAEFNARMQKQVVVTMMDQAFTETNLGDRNKLTTICQELAHGQHLISSPNYNKAQAYQRNHSTESTLLRMLDTAYKTMDRSEATLLIALISAAFDMVVDSTQLQRLYTSFGVDGSILSWINSYLSERLQTTQVGSVSSPPITCNCGLPHRGLYLDKFYSRHTFCRSPTLSNRLVSISNSTPITPN